MLSDLLAIWSGWMVLHETPFYGCLNQHELALLGGGQFAPVYPGQFTPVWGGQFAPVKVVSLLRSTMVSFTGISNYLSSSSIVLGVFTRSALWWFILSTIVSFIRHQITPDRLKWINRLSGIVLGSFGLLVLYSIRG